MSPAERYRRLQVACLLTACLLLAVGAGWLALDSLRMAINMPAQLNYVDGYTVDDTLRLARGEPLYPNPEEAPYTVTVYTPGFFALGAILVKLGVDGFTAGRCITLCSMLVIAVVVGWTGFRRTGWVAVLVALTLLLQPLQWPWSLVIRPDLLAILLSVLAVLTASSNGDRRSIVLPALLCVGAVFTKQTAIAAPAAITICLFVRHREAAIRFATTFAFSILIGVVGLQWFTHGQFLFHTVTANANPFAFERTIALYGRFMVSSPLVAVVLGVMVVAAARRGRLSMVAIYALITLLTACAAGKVGSSMNYFLEPLIALALWTAHEFPKHWLSPRTSIRVTTATLGVVSVVLVSATSWIDQIRAHHAARSALPLHAELVRTVSKVAGPVVSDDATLLVGAGKSVHYRPFIMAQLADAGLWNQAPFLRELEEGTVAMIIYRDQPELLHESRYTLPMREIMTGRYRSAFSYRLGSSFVALRPVPDEAREAPVGGGE